MKRLLGLFVELPESEAPAAVPSPEVDTSTVVGDVDIEALLREADASLGTAALAPVASAAPAAAPTPPRASALDWSLDKVFQAGKVAPGRNSADTVLTLKTSLAQFPTEQRLAMVRAMDTADDTWDEASVVQDAKKRLLVLQHFTGHLGKDEAAKVAAISNSTAETKLANDGRIGSLDAQISELQAKREGLLAANAQADQKAQDQTAAVKGRADARREEVTQRCDDYKRLIAFFEVSSVG